MSAIRAVLLACSCSLAFGLSFTHHNAGYKSDWILDWICLTNADCNQFGTCDGPTGTCQCEPAHFGQRCERKRCPTMRGKACSGHGACMTQALLTLPDSGVSAGRCLCEDGYAGQACELKECLDDCAPGNRRAGYCERDSSKALKMLTFRLDTLNQCTCFPGSYGENCGYKRCPLSARGLECDSDVHPEVANGHPSQFAMTLQKNGQCNRITGKCECTPGNYGAACELRQCPGDVRTVRFGQMGDKSNQPNPSGACANQGTCEPSTGKCSCFPGFHGHNCALLNCPNSTRGLICDNRGTCDSSTGNCQCSTATPWPGLEVAAFGKDCSLKHCPAVNGEECDEQGTCDFSSGLCTCFEGRYGHDCSLRRCPRAQTVTSGQKAITLAIFHKESPKFSECNARGSCDTATGRCQCEPGWYGADCALRQCPQHLGLTCNGEGSCDVSVGVCLCNSGFTGTSCENRKCQSKASMAILVECSGHGSCSLESGLCQCQTDYFGHECELKSCPKFHGRLCNLNGQCISAELDGYGVTGSVNVGDGHKLLPGLDGRGRETSLGTSQLQRLSGSAQGKCMCTPPYYGESCQFKTCPISKGRELQCDGHGACSKETGTCRCTLGYSGLDCSVGTCPEIHNRVCNNQGKCMQTNNLVDPVDHNLWGHDGNSMVSLEDESLSRGVEYPDTADDPSSRGWGYCICTPPFYGRSCEKKRCPVSTSRAECGGHGTCDTNIGVCRCAEGYSGRDCSHKLCPSHSGQVCNSQGVCQLSNSLEMDQSQGTIVFKSSVLKNSHVGVCTCKFPYFGASCELRGCPSERVLEQSWLALSEEGRQALDCSGNGACSHETGTCTCTKGWYGPLCNQLACPDHDGKICNLHGTCTRTAFDESSAGSQCACTAPYYGDACQFKRCPASKARTAVPPQGTADWLVYTNLKSYQGILWGKDCDGHGSCNQDTGRCTCTAGYSGESCERKDCPVFSGYECNNVGTCVYEDQSDDNLGSCQCIWPYFGADCSKKHCPVSGSNTASSWHGVDRAQECDGHGICNYDTGRCNCDDGFSGLECSTKKGLCPMSNKNRQREWRSCNGEGSCNEHTGQCHCYSEEFSGLDCSYRRCPFYPELNGDECNSHGDCVQAFGRRGEWTGVCQCHEGWSGTFCHEQFSVAAGPTSHPPPSYHAPVADSPLQSEFITSKREHIILGSQGYLDTRRAANHGVSVDREVDADSTMLPGSYQVPMTWDRSEDYYAGQHPVDVGMCLNKELAPVEKYLKFTGSQVGSSICTYPAAHPAWSDAIKALSLEDCATTCSGLEDCGGFNMQGEGCQFCQENVRNLSPGVTAYIKLNNTECQKVSTGQDPKQPVWKLGSEIWEDASTSAGVSVSPRYHGTGGPQYAPVFTRVTNDVGQY